MSLDTIKLKSPALSARTIEKIECLHSSKRKISVGTSHGDIEHQFVAASLKSSFDSSVSMKIEQYCRGNVEGRPVKVPCAPYLIVECSIHKVMAGHNIYGGPQDVAASVLWLIAFLSNAIGEELPPANEWMIRKIDYAEVFQLQSSQAVTQWFEGLQLGDKYRNRTIHRYGNHGIQIGGSTTCLKFYHKGPEFTKHDAKRLKATMNPTELDRLQQLADTLLRVEVSIKAQKLDYDFDGQPTIANVTQEYLQRVYDKEVGSFLREGTTSLKRIRNIECVKARLFDIYGLRLGRNVFATWLELAVFGEEAVRSRMRQSTFYEHIRYLTDAGCSWHGTDLIVERSDVPEDFAPLRSDVRMINDVLPDVSEKLKPFSF